MKPRALFVSPFLPYNTGHGGGLRLWNMLQSLSEGYDLDVLCLARPWEREFIPRVAALASSLVALPADRLAAPLSSHPFMKFAHLVWPTAHDGNRAVDSSPLRARFLEVVGQRKYDLYYFAFFSTGHLAGALPAGALTVFDPIHTPHMDDLHALSLEKKWRGKLYYGSQWLKGRRALSTLKRRFKIVLAVSRSEADMWRRAGGNAEVLYVPIGIPLKNIPFQPASQRPSRCVAYIGYFGMNQNIDAAEELCRHIMPRVWVDAPDVRVELVGPMPDNVRHLETPGRVALRGMIPSPACFMDLTLMAAPIRLGSGFKTKMVEAMAAGLPIVASPEANSSIGAGKGEILLAENHDDFARHILALLSSPAQAEQLSQNARRFAQENFDWEKNIQPFWTSLEEKVKL